jgi:hypothetical protein
MAFPFEYETKKTKEKWKGRLFRPAGLARCRRSGEKSCRFSARRIDLLSGWLARKLFGIFLLTTDLQWADRLVTYITPKTDAPRPGRGKRHRRMGRLAGGCKRKRDSSHPQADPFTGVNGEGKVGLLRSVPSYHPGCKERK